MDNIKRAELHLHTKLSDEVSVIGVGEIFENAEKLGINSIGFTNLNNVQDFPEIMMYAKKYENIKVIYGAEVQYKSDADSPIYHLTLLAKNQAGIKELYKVISSIDDNLIDLKVLKENRKNLLVGSCGSKGKMFDLMKQDKVLNAITTFYDFFEIFPSKDALECETNKKIFYLGEELGVPVVAVSNGRCIVKTDKVCLDIVNLAQGNETIPTDEYYIRTTKEMLEEFSYLGDYGAEKVVLENAETIVKQIEKAMPIKDSWYNPIFENAALQLKDLCYNEAHKIYGEILPEIVEKRLSLEFDLLSSDKIATHYLIAKRITDFAQEKGILTCSRGAIGSVFVAFLIGISKVNPLQPHYYCPHCNYFEEDEKVFDGFDLVDKNCPVCNQKLKYDGHNIPNETFMGYDGRKMPDIDLNIPESFRSKMQKFIDEMFGKIKVAQAGVIHTVWERAAENYIKKYECVHNIKFTTAEKSKYISKIIGVKSSFDVHPSGLMIIPEDMDFEDFTPLNQNYAPKPATQLDFHNLHNTILKQDILGITTINFIMELEKLTGKNIKDISFNDPNIYLSFKNSNTKGIPEFDTDFVRDMLSKTNPQSFNDLVKISCLCHGTNVWTENAEYLIKNSICTISEVIAANDDIFLYLTSKGMDKLLAYRIMEITKKGFWATDKLSNVDIKCFTEEMLKVNVPEWYIQSISKIRYMFPKAHAVANVINAVILMWFKIYYPKEFNRVLSKADN